MVESNFRQVKEGVLEEAKDKRLEGEKFSLQKENMKEVPTINHQEEVIQEGEYHSLEVKVKEDTIILDVLDVGSLGICHKARKGLPPRLPVEIPAS